MRQTLAVAIITKNEEANLDRTLSSVAWADELIVVDSGSTDRTEEVAATHKARFIRHDWAGFAAQKNFALAQTSSDWILSLDADEEVSTELSATIRAVINGERDSANVAGYFLRRRNHFLGRWIRHGGYYPDPKLRLVRRGAATFEARLVHEDIRLEGRTQTLEGDLIHHCYPSLSEYIEHMNRYSSLGAEQLSASGRGRSGFLVHVALNPAATFIYNYFFRLGFLDGREGLLQHLYHSVYISWKYAKGWEMSPDIRR